VGNGKEEEDFAGGISRCDGFEFTLLLLLTSRCQEISLLFL